MLVACRCYISCWCKKNLLISCQENGGDIIHYVNIYSAPSSPRKLSLSTVRYFPNLIIATWTPPIPKNGIITAYSVYCNTSVNSLIIGAKTNATTLVVTINTGSVMFTQYSCYVTANTSIGEGTPSQMITIESREPHRICYSCRSIFPYCHIQYTVWAILLTIGLSSVFH